MGARRRAAGLRSHRRRGAAHPRARGREPPISPAGFRSHAWRRRRRRPNLGSPQMMARSCPASRARSPRAMRRSTRERYRILSEAEFLADPSVHLRDDPRSRRHGLRGRRVAGVAMLLGTAASVAGVAAASVLVSNRHARFARGSRRTPSAIALAAPPRPPAVGAQRQAGRPRARSQRDRSLVRSARTARRQRAAQSRSVPRRFATAGGTARDASARATAGVELAAAHDRPATADRRTVIADAGATASPRGAGEFGFER
jgi:hypothetical protein